MNKPQTEIVKSFAVVFMVIAVLLVLMPLTLIRAYPLYKLWNWYFVPELAAHPISLITSFAVCLAFSVVFYRYAPSNGNHSVMASIGQTIAMALITLLFGWVGTWFL